MELPESFVFRTGIVGYNDHGAWLEKYYETHGGKTKIFLLHTSKKALFLKPKPGCLAVKRIFE